MSAEIWTKVERVAEHLGIPDTTVRTWRRKDRNDVPPYRHKEFVDAAEEIGISLTYDELNSIQ